VLRRESNGECVIGLVLGHGGEGDVLGVREVGTRGAVVVTQQLGNLTDTIRAVVEEEDGVVI
jgi:hypothetical protein